MQVVVQDGRLAFLLLQGLDVLVEQRLEQLDRVRLDFEVDEAVREDGVAEGNLQVELRLQQRLLLDVQHSVDDLLVRQQSVVWVSSVLRLLTSFLSLLRRCLVVVVE